MSGFEWTTQLSIGIEPMDKDHQKIIALMNELDRVHSADAPFGQVDRAFRQLVDFTRKHFSDEEAYMEAIEFEQLKSHKQIHARLLNSLDEHYADFKQSMTLNDQVFSFLRFWLKSHICGIDRKYAAHAHA
ncbi:MAG: bacteriohemerythrin [Gammaproteobacteria bacterium]